MACTYIICDSQHLRFALNFPSARKNWSWSTRSMSLAIRVKVRCRRAEVSIDQTTE